MISCPTREQILQRAERTFDDGRDVQKALPNAVFGELEDGLLGPAQHLLGFVGVVDGFGNGVLGDVDQPAQQRLVAHDANVVLDARPLGHAVDERRQDRDAANRLHFLAAVEFLDQGDHVHRPAGLLQIAHAGVNAAVGISEKSSGVRFSAA